MELRNLRPGATGPNSNTAGVWEIGMVPLVGLVLALALAMSFAAPAWAADAVTGQAEKDGVLYTFEVADGEATITKIEKAPGNAAETYQALIPTVVGKDGTGGWQALSGVAPDGTNTFLVTAIGEQAAGGRVYADTPTSEAVEYNDEITRIVVPGMVTQIGDNAFAGCRKATEVVFDVDDVADAEEHASHVERIGDYAFAGCSSVAAWNLPDSLLRVGARAFLYGACDSITRLKLPAAPTQWAATRVTFSQMPLCTEIVVPEGCVNFPDIRMKKVERVVLPSTLRGDVSIMSASGGSTSLEEIEVHEGCVIDALQAEYGEVDKVVVPEGVRSVYVRGPFTQLELPSTLTSISQILAPNLTSVEIPASVRSVGSYAFAYDTALESVSFSPFSSLRTLNVRTFRDCRLLKSIELPGYLATIGTYTFQGCDALEEVQVQASVIDGIAPFKDCANLRRISFAARSLMTQPDVLAEGCPKLTEVALPENASMLASTADHLLSDCPALERVYTFNPDFVMSDSMFPGCGDKFSVYGWGVDGNVLNSCEASGLTFVPYAELDGSGRNGAANVEVVAESADAARATCRFSTPLSFDYERELVGGEDYTLSKVERDGLAYLRLTGNGVTCFGEVEVPAKQDLASASVAEIGRQVVSGGRAACPRPRIELGGRTLALGADYTLSYTGNDRAGTATVMASGVGNYAGSVSATFVVAERHELSGGGASAADRASAALTAATLPGMPEHCDAVVVAWAHDHAAVAAACALAVAKDAQLLAVSSAGGLTDAQKAALAGWGATRAIVVGGAAACGAGAVGDLAAAGLACEEVGASADGTAALSAAVASAGSGSWGRVAVVANPADPAMCLAAAAYAGAVRGPLVLTGDDGMLPTEAASALAGFTDVVIAGDFAAVDASLESSLPAGATVLRAESPSALVEHGKEAGIFSSADATYTVAARDASTSMAYAASAGRAKAPLTVS